MTESSLHKPSSFSTVSSGAMPPLSKRRRILRAIGWLVLFPAYLIAFLFTKSASMASIIIGGSSIGFSTDRSDIDQLGSLLGDGQTVVRHGYRMEPVGRDLDLGLSGIDNVGLSDRQQRLLAHLESRIPSEIIRKSGGLVVDGDW